MISPTVVFDTLHKVRLLSYAQVSQHLPGTLMLSPAVVLDKLLQARLLPYGQEPLNIFQVHSCFCLLLCLTHCSRQGCCRMGRSLSPFTGYTHACTCCCVRHTAQGKAAALWPGPIISSLICTYLCIHQAAVRLSIAQEVRMLATH